MNNILDTFELYKGKRFSDVCKEVVVNQNSKKDQLDILVSELRPLIKTPNDAVIIVPMIRDYLEVGVKNDEQLVKLLGVVQRIFTKSTEGEQGDDTLNSKLSPEEIAQLKKEIDNISDSVTGTIDDSVKELDSKK